MSALEHRYKKRLQVLLDVVIWVGSGLKLRGKSRDISTDGIFVKLAPQTILTSTIVDVELSCCGSFRGWVVHTGDEGIGIMFCSAGDQEHALLKKLLLKLSKMKHSAIRCVDGATRLIEKKEG